MCLAADNFSLFICLGLWQWYFDLEIWSASGPTVKEGMAVRMLLVRNTNGQCIETPYIFIT